MLFQDSDRSSADSPGPASGGTSMHEHQMMMDSVKNLRKRRRSPSPENLEHAKRAAVAQAHLNGTSKNHSLLFFCARQPYMTI